MVEEEITQRGHLVMFYPKFHCELNWIKYFWGDGSEGLNCALHLQRVKEDSAGGA
jgi:hypothetical protein